MAVWVSPSPLRTLRTRGPAKIFWSAIDKPLQHGPELFLQYLHPDRPILSRQLQRDLFFTGAFQCFMDRTEADV